MSINPANSIETRQKVDLLILTNGPGEVATWVRPVVKQLKVLFGEMARISVILSPCPHASGLEQKVLKGYREVDRIQTSEHFFDFLLWGKTYENWDWYKNGVVIFLGGDQFYTLLISKRLGYRNLTYAEWEARWPGFLDSFAARNKLVKDKVSSKYQNKVNIVGDLMLEVETKDTLYQANSHQIGLMVGSKGHKLAIGVPFCLAIAQALNELEPEYEFMIPLAPTVDLDMLAYYANPLTNPLIEKIGLTGASLISEEIPYLQTKQGLKIKLYSEFPAHSKLLQCSLVITTVGANTAELAALGIPMWVILPTQQIDIMRTWEGLPGILSRLPVLGTTFAKAINSWFLKQNKLYAWPNIWANEEVVPEKIGIVEPTNIAREISLYLQDPTKLEKIRAKLEKVRGDSGAACKISELVREQIAKSTSLL